jgi:hypothetical protein
MAATPSVCTLRNKKSRPNTWSGFFCYTCLNGAYYGPKGSGMKGTKCAYFLIAISVGLVILIQQIGVADSLVRTKKTSIGCYQYRNQP